MRWLILALTLLGQLTFAQVHVRGYHRKDGTYVRPHYRSSPDGIFSNNWSTYRNVNPYTGAVGTKRTPPDGYGSDVSVGGYFRSNGTYVSPHYRSAPDGDPSNNWSTYGNINPHTGAIGTKRAPLDGRGSDVSAGGLFGSARTYVPPHKRSSLGVTPPNNLGMNRTPSDRSKSQASVLAYAGSGGTHLSPHSSSALGGDPSHNGRGGAALAGHSVGSQAASCLLPSATSNVEEAPSPVATVVGKSKKTRPGLVRIGIQTGQLPSEILTVAIEPAGQGQLRFIWRELDQVVSVTASEQSEPIDVVRNYRAAAEITRASN